jgi:lipoate-protein ligase A
LTTGTSRPAGDASRWRLLDDVATTDSAVDHMRTDIEMLERVAAGDAPALRLYTWPMPTLSLGRFQDAADVDADTCARLGVWITRRPTGGAALLHGADLTYAVAMPLPTGADPGVQPVYDRIAGALIAGLRRLGVAAAIARHDGPPGAVCFAGQQGADLRVGDRKVCGSAQVRRHGVVLQHGSILLRRLEFDECDLVTTTCDRDALRRATVTLEELGAPTDARSVAGAIAAGFGDSLGVSFGPAPLVAQGADAHR